MNTALLKAKMDKFFAEVSPEYLVKEFEKMGYTFIDSDINWEPPKNYSLVTEAVLIEVDAPFFIVFVWGGYGTQIPINFLPQFGGGEGRTYYF